MKRKQAFPSPRAIGLWALAVVALSLCAAATYAGPMVTDTFSRGPSDELGTTEDAGHYPWQYGYNDEFSVYINGDNKLEMSKANGEAGAYINNFQVADFDVTFWLTSQSVGAGYTGVWYRDRVPAARTGTGDDIYGYLWHWQGTDNVMYLWSAKTGHLFGGAVAADMTQPNKIRLKVVGNEHMCWVNDVQAYDVFDNSANPNNDPGYIGWYHDGFGTSYTDTVDDISLEVLDQFGTVSGKVLVQGSSTPINGASVTLWTKNTTSNATGDYSVSGITAGDRTLIATHPDYYTVYETLNVPAGPLSHNIEMVPLGSPDAVVYDHVQRADGPTLGTTEDAAHYPWQENPSNAAGAVSGNKLAFTGGGNQGATIGGFAPANIDMTFTAQVSENNADQASVVYRGSIVGGGDPNGYTVTYIPLDDTVNLTGDGGQTLASATLPVLPWSNGVPMRIRAIGRHHEIWVNNDKVIDYLDANAGARNSSGYITLAKSGSTQAYFSNIDINAWDVANLGSVTGKVTDPSGTGLANAELAVLGSAAIMTDSNGNYALNDVLPGSLRVFISKAGYDASEANITVGDGQNVVQNIVLTPIPAGWIYDTFTRPDSSVLGTTEDPLHVSWIKGLDVQPDAGTVIKDHQLWEAWPQGSGAGLGDSGGNPVRPLDFDASFDVRMTQSGPYIEVQYRGRAANGPGNIDNANGYRFQMQTGGVFYLYSGNTGHLFGQQTSATDWTGPHHIRLRVDGDWHRAWLDGALLMDLHNSANMLAGTLDFCHYGQGCTYDNIKILILELQNVASVGLAKQVTQLQKVALGEAIVTGEFNGFIYVEDASRASGIKVITDADVAIGDKVSVTGYMDTLDGEMIISANSGGVSVASSGNDLEALTMRPRSVQSSTGLSAIGLLVKTFGTVLSVDAGSNSFRVDDGSINDGTGLKVLAADGTTLPSVGQKVSVTGDAGKSGSDVVVRMRAPGDLTVE